ncbi:MAG: DsbA family protein [Pseudomonadota bacterium]
MQNQTQPDLIYGFDALCGWCYGLIPAMRALVAQRPELKIEIVHGGLVTGDRVGPYSQMADYIRGASARMSEVTGQKLSPAFFQLIESEPPIISGSAKPAWAIMQMRTIAPEYELAFAHGAQEAHFRDGKDLNDPQTYADIAAAHGLPLPDLSGLERANEGTPIVRDEFARAGQMGIRSFPTLAIRTAPGSGGYSQLTSVYDPAEFVTLVSETLPTSS